MTDPTGVCERIAEVCGEEIASRIEGIETAARASTRDLPPGLPPKGAPDKVDGGIPGSRVGVDAVQEEDRTRWLRWLCRRRWNSKWVKGCSGDRADCSSPKAL